jgi:hypothetical protein
LSTLCPTICLAAASTTAGHKTPVVRFRDLPAPPIVSCSDRAPHEANDGRNRSEGGTMPNQNLLRTTIAAAALLVMAPSLSAQEAVEEATRTNERVQVQTRDRARIHADGTEQQRIREENRVNERIRNGDGTGQAQRARAQAQNRIQSARNAQRDMIRRQLRDMNRSRARDVARTRSRVHRTAP